ncbi:hypothetical protein ACFQ6O_30075 [Streptomyces sp. NPDC056441]|uniref:hypothetical protein n=1 Tax=Streptomyces sp. NPDC056441 TaxID=3345817 RepID=UPI00367D80ED
MVTCVVAYFVYKHTRQAPTGKGNAVRAIGSNAMALTALVLILGGSHPEPQTPAPARGGAPPNPASPIPGP